MPVYDHATFAQHRMPVYYHLTFGGKKPEPRISTNHHLRVDGPCDPRDNWGHNYMLMLMGALLIMNMIRYIVPYAYSHRSMHTTALILNLGMIFMYISL